MPRLTEIISDDKKELEGTWMPFDDGEVLVARLYNPRFNEIYNAAAKKYGRKMRTNAKIQEKVMIDAMSQTILLDWKGFTDEKDKEVKYTPAVGVEWLTKSRELRNRITEIATDFENFRQDSLEEDLGNSKSS